MAEVFLARAYSPAGTPVTVVVKRILPHLSEEEEFRGMFVDEARVASTLRHPNIVRMLDLGRIDQHLFIALEYIDGTDLHYFCEGLRDRNELFPVADAIFVTTEILKGLQHAHTRTRSDGAVMDLVHRDVTPSNVLLARTGSVKIADFGIAKAKGRDVKTTVRGKVKGKIRYLAPEQIREGVVDARTDVYAAGMVLHELLTGKHPFDDDLLHVAVHRLVEGDVPPPSRGRPGLPAELDMIVKKTIHPDRTKRWASAVEMRLALEAFATAAGHVLDGDWLTQQLLAMPAAPSSEAKKALSVITSSDVTPEGEETFSEEVTPPEIAQEPAPAPAPAPAAPPAPRIATWLKGHREGVTALAVSGDGMLIASASLDHTVRVWDLVSQRERVCLNGHLDGATSAALSLDGSVLLSGGLDRTVRVWDVESAQQSMRLETTAPIAAVDLSPDGRRIAAGGFDGALRVWEVDRPDTPRVLRGHAGAITWVAFLPDGRTAVTASRDHTVRLWDAVAGTELRTLECSPAAILCAARTADGAFALVAAGPQVFVWDLRRGSEVSAWNGPGCDVKSICSAGGGRVAASGGASGMISLWSPRTGRDLGRLTGHETGVEALAMTSDASLLFSGGADGAIGVWNLTRG